MCVSFCSYLKLYDDLYWFITGINLIWKFKEIKDWKKIIEFGVNKSLYVHSWILELIMGFWQLLIFLFVKCGFHLQSCVICRSISSLFLSIFIFLLLIPTWTQKATASTVCHKCLIKFKTTIPTLHSSWFFHL